MGHRPRGICHVPDPPQTTERLPAKAKRPGSAHVSGEEPALSCFAVALTFPHLPDLTPPHHTRASWFHPFFLPGTRAATGAERESREPSSKPWRFQGSFLRDRGLTVTCQIPGREPQPARGRRPPLAARQSARTAACSPPKTPLTCKNPLHLAILSAASSQLP